MKASAYCFANQIDRKIEALPSIEYFQRPRRCKVLLEELLPISRLALHLKQPGLEVEVEAFENDGEPDGHIQITGFREQEFNVQVTCDFTYEESLRNELIASKGFSPGAGDIHRDKKSKDIITTASIIDTDEHIGRVSESVMKLYQEKAKKSYRKNTALVIAFDAIKLYGSFNWCQLFASLEQAGGLSGSNFIAVYLFNSATNELHRAT